MAEKWSVWSIACRHTHSRTTQPACVGRCLDYTLRSLTFRKMNGNANNLNLWASHQHKMYIWINLVRRQPTRRRTRKVCVSIVNWRTAPHRTDWNRRSTAFTAKEFGRSSFSIVVALCLSLFFIHQWSAFAFSTSIDWSHWRAILFTANAARSFRRNFVFVLWAAKLCLWSTCRSRKRQTSFSLANTRNGHSLCMQFSVWRQPLWLKQTQQTLRCAIRDFPLGNYMKWQAISNNNQSVFYFRFYWSRFSFCT